MIKVLLVDDEPDILEFLEYNLKQIGFFVYTAKNGKNGLELAIKEHPEIIVLDVMMPKLNGFEVCSRLREIDDFKDTIILFLTAKMDDNSYIAGLEAGADDYIIKPVRIKVFIAKLHTLLKRKMSNPMISKAIGSKCYGQLTIDFEQRKIFVQEKQVQLRPKEFGIITLLTSIPGKVFSREEIFASVWNTEDVGNERSLDVHISQIRGKIGNNSIVTLRGTGYKFQMM